MKLFLANGDDPKNAVLTLEDGQVMYKITTPFKITGRTTTISRVVPNSDITQPTDVEMRDRFAQIAEIEWQVISSSKLKFGENEVEANSYLRKVGLGPYGRHRAFTGPDGREYKWKLGVSVPELYLSDGSKTLVAKFHRPWPNLFGPSKHCYLEVFPEGEHILDTIIVTFVYVEKIRKDSERAAQA